MHTCSLLFLKLSCWLIFPLATIPFPFHLHKVLSSCLWTLPFRVSPCLLTMPQPGFLLASHIIEMAPVKVTIDLHDAKSNGHFISSILFKSSLEFNTVDRSLFLKTFSFVSSLTLLHVHVYVFFPTIVVDQLLTPLQAALSLCNLIPKPLFSLRHCLPGVLSQSMFFNTNYRMMPPYFIPLALASPLISRLIYPSSNLTLPHKCLIIYSNFQYPIQQDLLNLPLNHILNPKDWTDWVIASGGC